MMTNFHQWNFVYLHSLIPLTGCYTTSLTLNLTVMKINSLFTGQNISDLTRVSEAT